MMENEIEVGEYIRTKDGKIGVIGFPDDEDEENMFKQRQFEWYSNGKSYDLIKENEIIKHSKNIIDLIEEGDILKLKEKNTIIWLGIEKEDAQLNHKEIMHSIKNKEVELLSIVTKEQFKSVEYEV